MAAWGQIFMTWLYGLEVFAFCYSAHLFISTRHASRLYIIFGGVILALSTITFITDAILCQFVWIDHRDWPGGPVEYLVTHISSWRQVLGTAACQMTNILADSLLLYRCYLIYNGRWKVVIVPFLIHLGASAMAIALLVESALPDSDFFHGLVVQFGICWAALSVTLNVVVTILVVVRILRARRSMQKHFPDRIDSINAYTSLIAIMVESSLPFTVIGVIFAITYGRNLDIGTAFLFVWGALSALSPQLIIFRIASGRAWTRRVAADISEASYLEASEISGAIDVPRVGPTFKEEKSTLDKETGSTFTKKASKSEKLSDAIARRKAVAPPTFRYTERSPRSSDESFRTSGEESV